MTIEQSIQVSQSQILEISEFQKQEITQSGKSIHYQDWNIQEYCEIFRIPPKKLKKIKKWFLSILPNPEGDEIRVLSPGVGAGRNELELIQALSQKYKGKKVICDFVDYSQNSCSYLINKILPQKNFELKEKNPPEFKFIKDDIQINVHVKDYEEWLGGNDKKYDVVLSFFVFSFLSDWRESILKTIELLNENGILVVSQDLGDLCFLDNTFYEEDIPEKDSDREKFYRLWKEYYRLRREYGLDWNNLISPSNMSFVEQYFKDIHRLVGQETDIDKDFKWQLSDLDSETANEFKKLDFWIKLIEGKDESDIVFDCLNIPKNIKIDGKVKQLRKGIANNLSVSFGGKTVKNLKLGEKLFYLRKPKNETNFSEISRYVLERKNFDVGTVTDFRFHNRQDNLDQDEKTSLSHSLLNRALDVYNCFIHDKGESMVSLFSKALKFEKSEPKYDWRKKETPIVYPTIYKENQYHIFVLSYALYFFFRTDDGGYPQKLTDIVHGDFPVRIGLIFKLVEDEELTDDEGNIRERVKPVFYKNGQTLKALLVKLSWERFQRCQTIIKNLIKSRHEFKEFVNQLEKEYDHTNSFFFTSKLIELRDKFLENELDKSSIFDDLKLHFNPINSESLWKDIEKFLKLSIDNSEIENKELEKVFKSTKEVFESIYLIALSHPVECNVIYYTTTNIDYSKEDKDTPQEQSYYGLIVADRIKFADSDSVEDEDGYIKSYFNQLLSNTFSYSGMDGIHESKILEKKVEWVRIVDEMSHSMAFPYGTIQNALREIKVATKKEKLELIEENRKQASQIITHLSKINKFLFYIVKFQDIENIPQTSEANEILKWELLDIKDIVKKTYSYIKDANMLLQIEEKHKNKILSTLESSKLKVFSNLEKVNLTCMKSGFEIVFLDLTKNAFKHTDRKNPIVNIKFNSFLEADQDHVSISWENNQTMTEEAYEFIEFGNEGENFSKSTKVGVRTINRILDYFSNYKDGKWELKVDPISIDSEYSKTIIHLLIPKKYCYVEKD